MSAPIDLFDASEIANATPLESIRLRPLRSNDDVNGFFELLSELTTAPRADHATFAATFDGMRREGGTAIVVAVDAGNDAKLLGAATLIVERKFIHNLRPVGHVEDVVVASEARGRRIGLALIAALLELAQKRGCYKTILDCAEDKVAFYERNGFERKSVHMAVYFKGEERDTCCEPDCEAKEPAKKKSCCESSSKK